MQFLLVAYWLPFSFYFDTFQLIFNCLLLHLGKVEKIVLILFSVIFAIFCCCIHSFYDYFDEKYVYFVVGVV